MSELTSIHSLRSESQTSVTQPPSRWLMRLVLPMVIIGAAGLMLLYVARDALLPAIDVEVMPVLTRAAPPDEQSGEGKSGEAVPDAEPVVMAQAPGWIEPDPYAVTVQSLIPGVVQDVFVLEGQRVEEGEVIARLIDDDAELDVRRARAELHELSAAAEQATADLESAEARLDEVEDEVDRKRDLVEIGGVSPGEYARLQHRLRSQRAGVQAARAALKRAEASIERQQVIIEEAELALERTVIRAPVSGIVLTRSAVPGTRISTNGGMGRGGGIGPAGEGQPAGIVRLYDPESVQVRADVPLADAAKVGLGTLARITTDAAPEHTFLGEVTRIVHQADIQRNTVQMKVRIHEPGGLLKPDMLVRVRFVAAGGGLAQRDNTAGDTAPNGSSLRLFIPEAAIVSRRGEVGQVWAVRPGAGRSLQAALLDVTLGESDGELVLVRGGVRPGDRLITHPPETLRSGVRVRIQSPQAEAGADLQGN